MVQNVYENELDFEKLFHYDFFLGTKPLFRKIGVLAPIILYNRKIWPDSSGDASSWVGSDQNHELLMWEKGIWICSLGNISAIVKGAHVYNDTKDRQYKVVNEGAKLFVENIFWPKIFKTPLISAIFGRKNGTDKNFWQKKLRWSESIKNRPNYISKWNLDFEKNFHYDFPLGT